MQGAIKIIFLLVTCLIPLSVWAKSSPPKKSPDLKEKIKQLTQEIHTINLLKTLQLTEEQLEKLLPLAKKSGEIHHKYKEIQDQLSGEMEKAFKDFKREDEKNQGFSQEVERRTARASSLGKKLKKKFCDEINELEKQAMALLTLQQRKKLEAYRPTLFPRPISTWEDQAVQFLQRVRRLPAWKWEFQRDHLIQQVLKRTGAKKKIKKGGNHGAKKQIGDMLDKVRKMSPQEFQREKGKIIQSFRSKDRVTELRERLAEIHKGAYGDIGPAGRFLLHGHAAEVIETTLQNKKGASKEEKNPQPI